MPRIFDNIDQSLFPALQQTLETATHADFCVGYLNLRGWRGLAPYVENWDGGEGDCCRLLVGMQRLPEEELREAKRIAKDGGIDNQTALRLKRRLAEEFREQLTIGVPTRQDEIGLRQLARQLREKKVQVKLFLRHTLHAKLYLIYRSDLVAPTVGYLGSSNLTLSGLSHQGELNVDVVDSDACEKLEDWFEDRWNDRWCIDISKELAEIIEESWAREEPIPPYHIYVKMAYHLSQEARAGLTEFQIPREFEDKLFEFQTAAVKIAAHHLNRRGGVLIGDVVGLGKTLMGTALARIQEDDYDLETLIICPKNLVNMWEDYREEYRLRGRVLSISQVINTLPDLRRYRLVMIDESHNLRGRVRARLQQNAEVVGTDEAFFEDDGEEGNERIVDLYNEKAGLLDDARDNDVDLASHAYQIWKNAITQDSSLEKSVSALPSVVYSTQPHTPTDNEPEGALVYIRTGQENDALAWMDRNGESVTESQFAILQAAACEPDTEPLPPLEEHHRLVEAAAKLILSEERTVGGQLGRPSGARFRTYERLKDYASEVEGTLLNTPQLKQVIEAIYRYPLRQAATDTLNRQLRSGISNADLAALVIERWETERLCIIEQERQTREPQIVCSLGIRGKGF